MSQFEAQTNARIAVLEQKLSTYGYYPVGAIHISADSNNPSALFGGIWELYSQGYFVVGQESEVPELLQSLEACYVWKRTE